jgi:hypothetical protein
VTGGGSLHPRPAFITRFVARDRLMSGLSRCNADDEVNGQFVTVQRAHADFTVLPGRSPSATPILNRRLQSLHQSPGRVAEEQADGGFPVLAIGRGCLGITCARDLGEFVLTHHDAQYDFAACASLAQHAGALGSRHRHWWCPMNIEII